MSIEPRSLIPALLFCLGGFSTAAAPSLAWEQTKTSLALRKHDKTVWHLAFDPAKPKSYFHPLASIEGRVMTAFEPADHPWHRGLWWSWKYINGVNYWEENRKTGKSDGLTMLARADAMPADDFSARIELDFHYHPPEQKPVLTENRHISISRPDDDGTYVIDWKSKFTAGDQAVKLDRTVPEHLGGVSYGGYAGLSLRMANGLNGFSFRTYEGETSAAASHGKSARWIDLADDSSGITILDHPGNLRHAPPWYMHSGSAMLFTSPSPLFNEALELAPGAAITMAYRIIVHSKPITQEHLEDQWKTFSRLQPQKP